MNVLLWSPELKFYYLKYSMWSSLSLSRRMNVCSHGLDLSRSNPDRLINHDLWATGLLWSTGWRTRSAGGPALYFTVTTLWAWPLTDGLFFPTWGKQRLNLCQVCMSFIFLHLIVHCGAVMTNMVHWFLSEATCSALRCGCLLLLPALHVAVWSNSWQFDGVIDALVGRLIVCWAELLFCVCPTVWSTPRWAELFLSEQLLQGNKAARPTKSGIDSTTLTEHTHTTYSATVDLQYHPWPQSHAESAFFFCPRESKFL